MKKRLKVTKAIKPKKISVSTPGKSNLSGFMAKIEQWLLSLEKKMDTLIGQNSTKACDCESNENKQVIPPSCQPEPFACQDDKKGGERLASSGTSPAAVGVPQRVRQGRGRRDRILHKAVCAECHKDCEIPFKPSGERPVYCKECFSKRKAEGSGKSPRVSPDSRQESAKPVAVAERVAPATAAEEIRVTPVSATVERQVTVIRKGVGKVTVSRIVESPTRAVPASHALRDHSRRNPPRKK